MLNYTSGSPREPLGQLAVAGEGRRRAAFLLLLSVVVVVVVVVVSVLLLVLVLVLVLVRRVAARPCLTSPRERSQAFVSTPNYAGKRGDY